MVERTAAPRKTLTRPPFEASTPPPLMMMLFLGMTTADNTTSLAPALDKNAPDYTWQRGVRYVSAAKLHSQPQSTVTKSRHSICTSSHCACRGRCVSIFISCDLDLASPASVALGEGARASVRERVSSLGLRCHSMFPSAAPSFSDPHFRLDARPPKCRLFDMSWLPVGPGPASAKAQLVCDRNWAKCW